MLTVYSQRKVSVGLETGDDFTQCGISARQMT